MLPSKGIPQTRLPCAARGIWSPDLPVPHNKGFLFGLAFLQTDCRHLHEFLTVDDPSMAITLLSSYAAHHDPLGNSAVVHLLCRAGVKV